MMRRSVECEIVLKSPVSHAAHFFKEKKEHIKKKVVRSPLFYGWNGWIKTSHDHSEPTSHDGRDEPPPLCNLSNSIVTISFDFWFLITL